MDKYAGNYRNDVIEHVELLASASDQVKYENEVPIADVPAELVCMFEDLYHPKSEPFLDAFREKELKSLARLYGMVCMAYEVYAKQDCHGVTGLLKLAEWRSVIAFAKDLAAELGRGRS